MACLNFCLKFLVQLFKLSNCAGHSAVLHGCTVEDEAFVGMGATLLDGVVVEKHAMVAAGALVRQNTRIPCGEVCVCRVCMCMCEHIMSIQSRIHSFLSFRMSMKD